MRRKLTWALLFGATIMMVTFHAARPVRATPAGGFTGTGFKKSPAVGACMAELVTEGQASTVDLHPFRLGRFAEGDPIVGDEYRLPSEFGHRL